MRSLSVVQPQPGGRSARTLPIPIPGDRLLSVVALQDTQLSWDRDGQAQLGLNQESDPRGSISVVAQAPDNSIYRQIFIGIPNITSGLDQVLPWSESSGIQAPRAGWESYRFVHLNEPSNGLLLLPANPPVSDQWLDRRWSRHLTSGTRELQRVGGLLDRSDFLWIEDIDGGSPIYRDRIPNIQNGFTFEAFINPTGFGQENLNALGVLIEHGPIIIMYDSLGEGDQTGGRIFVFLVPESGSDFIEAQTPIGSVEAGRWSHIAVTYQHRDGPQVYVDGISQPIEHLSPKRSGRLFHNINQPIRIGNFVDGGLAFFGGIDQARIWTGRISTNQLNLNRWRSLSPSGALAAAYNFDDERWTGLVRMQNRFPRAPQQLDSNPQRMPVRMSGESDGAYQRRLQDTFFGSGAPTPRIVEDPGGAVEIAFQLNRKAASQPFLVEVLQPDGKWRALQQEQETRLSVYWPINEDTVEARVAIRYPDPEKAVYRLRVPVVN